MAQESSGSGSGVTERLKKEAGGLVRALGGHALSGVRGKVEGTTSRLTDYVEGGGGPGIMAAVTGAKNLAEGKSPVRSMFGAGFAGVKEKVKGMGGGDGKGGGGGKIKVTNIVESIDVGAPVSLAYNQWTQWSDFPKFMKKVENVDQPEEHEKTTWKAQVFWSHRTWESTIKEQVPDDKIIWRSKGEKGYVDGAVTFHELAPNLTRVLVILEYHPQGMFEHTGNLWRAQGRRARLELKHFQRHLMTEVLLNPDDIEGWRGTIHDGEVVESHEDAIAREEKDSAGEPDAPQAGDDRAEEAAESDAAESSEAAAAEDEEPQEPDDDERGERNERPERGQRGERPERGQRGERPERGQRGERPERGQRGERPERGERGERPERGEEVAAADQEDREEDEVQGQESGNGQDRAASARAGTDAPRRGRRPAPERPADWENPGSAGNGRRQRTGAARRGGRT